MCVCVCVCIVSTLTVHSTSFAQTALSSFSLHQAWLNYACFRVGLWIKTGLFLAHHDKREPLWPSGKALDW